MHNNIAIFFPSLNGKVLNVDMTGAFCGDLGVDHFEGQYIVVVNWCWTRLCVTKFMEDEAKITCSFGRKDSSNKFSFS